MRCWAAACAGWLVFTAGCTAVPAPDLSPPGPASAAAALRRARTGQEVRLHQISGGEVAGRLQAAGFAPADTLLVVLIGSRLVTVDPAAVDTVWLRADRPRIAGRGVLLGAAVGAGLALIALAGDCHSCDDPGLGKAIAPYAFAFATSIGALGGSLAAAATREWVRVFPAIRSPRPW